MAQKKSGQQIAVRNEGRADLVFFDVNGKQHVVRRQGGTATAEVNDSVLNYLDTACKSSRPTLFMTKGEKAPEAEVDEVDPEKQKLLDEAEKAGHSTGPLPIDHEQAARFSREAATPVEDREGFEEAEAEDTDAGATGGSTRRKPRRRRKGARS